MRAYELVAAIFGAFSLSTIAQSQEARRSIDVMVYVKSANLVPRSINREAEGTASWIFTRIGVRIGWLDDEPRTAHAFASPIVIEVRFTVGTSAKVHPRALAYASRFAERGNIVVLWDRVREVGRRPELDGAILGHVLAHEIAHVLQGNDRHSRMGVMKADWNEHDFDAMEKRRLAFTPTDVDLIRQGLNRREAQAGYPARRPS